MPKSKSKSKKSSKDDGLSELQLEQIAGLVKKSLERYEVNAILEYLSRSGSLEADSRQGDKSIESLHEIIEMLTKSYDEGLGTMPAELKSREHFASDDYCPAAILPKVSWKDDCGQVLNLEEIEKREEEAEERDAPEVEKLEEDAEVPTVVDAPKKKKKRKPKKGALKNGKKRDPNEPKTPKGFSPIQVKQLEDIFKQYISKEGGTEISAE